MRKTIVVYLDVNGTIMAADLAQGKTAEIAIAHELAKKTRGIWHHELPEMLYQDYVEHHLIPGSEANAAIKKQRRELYLRFLAMLEERDHPLLEQIQATYSQLLTILHTQQSPLFASFWTLLQWAQQCPYDIRFVFRTFGHDLPHIIALLEQQGYKVQNLFCYEDDQLFRGYFNDTLFIKQDVCPRVEAIFSEQFNAVKDDWQRWNRNGETEAYAKPFHNFPEVISVFFDDNALEKQIIAPIGFTSENGAPLTTADLIERGYIVPVNPLKAMIQPEFFVKKIENLLLK